VDLRLAMQGLFSIGKFSILDLPTLETRGLVSGESKIQNPKSKIGL
jgi:hypothetical protein